MKRYSNDLNSGIFISGTSIVGSSIKTPRITAQNLISVIFCEAVAIYGVISGILLLNKPKNWNYTDDNSYEEVKIKAYKVFWSGAIVGLTNLTSGISVGVVGSGAALTEAN